MPERFEIYIVYKRCYINTLPFLSFPFLYTMCRRASNNSKTLLHNQNLMMSMYLVRYWTQLLLIQADAVVRDLGASAVVQRSNMSRVSVDERSAVVTDTARRLCTHI